MTSPSLSLLSPAAALRRPLALALGQHTRAAFARANICTSTAAAALAVPTAFAPVRGLHTTSALHIEDKAEQVGSAEQTEDAVPTGSTVQADNVVQTDDAYSTTPAPASPPRKRQPSPYRLPPLDEFHKAFKPLHTAGWWLTSLPQMAMPAEIWSGTTARYLHTPADLQDRRLRRVFTVPGTKDGWRALARAVQRISELAEAEDVSSSTDEEAEQPQQQRWRSSVS